MGKSRPRFNEKARASARKPTQKPYVGARDGGISVPSKHKEPRRPAAPVVDIANDRLERMSGGHTGSVYFTLYSLVGPHISALIQMRL